MEQRKKMVLDLAGNMQDCLEEDRLYDMDELVQEYSCWGKGNSGNCMMEENNYQIASGEECFVKLCRGFTYLEQLERLREEWTDVLSETKKTLYSSGYECYKNIREAFEKEFGNGGTRQQEWENYQENLLIFFLYTYFCGAVYDDWIYSKAAFCIFSVSFIQEFVMCRWFLADNYIDMQDFVELAYRYAREVEHSDENLNFLEECLNGETA